jgi:hypothetical protein
MLLGGKTDRQRFHKPHIPFYEKQAKKKCQLHKVSNNGLWPNTKPHFRERLSELGRVEEFTLKIKRAAVPVFRTTP